MGQGVLLSRVPYTSQLDVPFTDKYFASDTKRPERSPNGCWMSPASYRAGKDGQGYGREAQGCPGPRERGCIRPGSCNTASLYMLLKHFGLQEKPETYADGRPLAPWLQGQPFSPTWIYYFMMETWAGGEQQWDGADPRNANNSRICAKAEYLQQMVEMMAQQQPGRIRQVILISTPDFGHCQAAIDQGSPVVIHSARLHHLILGVGYEVDREEPYVVAHDPYGRMDERLSRWQAINGCGDQATFGENVLYPFAPLESRFLLYCRL